MSRSGYSDDCENLGLWRAAVRRGIRGKRGQAFLKKLAADMDAMPAKRLIADELVDEAGEACTIGVALVQAGKFTPDIDIYDYERIAKILDIPHSLVQEIEFINDGSFSYREWTPEERWQRMRGWVHSMLDGGDPG